jgi:hypothetical protein
MTNGDWTTPEARKKAKGRSNVGAQNRMYNLMLERDRIMEQIKILDKQNEILIEEARALLELYPGLLFRET